MNNAQNTLFICPMHPEVRREKQGRCPECGMNLVATKVDKGHAHDKHEGHSTDTFRNRFWINLALTIPITLYSSTVQSWLHVVPPTFPGSRFLPFILGTIIFFYGGLVFLQGAYRELRGRSPSMMTLIALAIIVAYGYSVATTFFIQGSEFFWELATLITIMLLGHWLEMKSVKGAQGALRELAKLLPDTAELADGKIVPLSDLHAADIVLIRPGSKIPADGNVVEGESEVNESMLTGESNPVQKQKGSTVIAGTVNTTGALKVSVAKVGDQTTLAGIMRLVEEAQSSRSRAQELGDKAAFYLTIIAIVSGIITFLAWIGTGLGFALERTVTVLVITCPHALGLAIPLVTAISTTMGAKKGLLIRQKLALEAARNVDVILFDKTGTLTKGEHGVIDIWPMQEYDEKNLLSLAASVEASSEHAIGKAVVVKAKEKQIALQSVQKFSALPGQGVEATIDGKMISVGGPQLLTAKKLLVPEMMKANVDRAGAEGKTILYVLEDGKIVGVITSADIVREESKRAVERLHAMDIRVAMLTGDSRAVAEYVAKQLGIKEYFAEILPGRKAEIVKQLQKDGSKVMFVGDGVNDAPALAQANVGIAIGAGTDVAIESAGIILVRNNPEDVASVIKLSKATYAKMVQNLVWATGYNVAAIPLAAGVLASYGILLSPAVGAIFMSASTIIVAFNAQLLRRLKL